MTTQLHQNVLNVDFTVLLVVDVQERFRPAIPEFDALVAGCCRLVQAFRLLDRPVLVTEQYPKGLGHTVQELKAVMGDAPIFEKTAFSSCGADGVLEALTTLGARQVAVCGIETHVCVNQTVHDLLNHGYQPQLALDAVASRNATDRAVALQRMEQSGVLATTSEAAAFELLRDARHPKFKEVQALFK